MSKIRIKNVQTAQGMVEFALVLPILLLVVLGVFAFGHMFFVYSSVVSASREAARWGAAVGTAGGAAGLPRYQDCGAIRAAAVRVGAFAGVSGSSVAIDYDSGPGSTVNSNHCIIGGTGPEVGLGDRIVVTITVQYRPIVPFIDLPTFPLTATSARTIIKSLPVGEAPTAKPLWPSTTIELNLPTTTDSPKVVVVGETLTLTVKVWDDEKSLSPTGGKVYVNDELGNNCTPNPLTPDKDGVTCTFKWPHVTAAGTLHEISARYEPEGAPFISSATTGYVKVDKAPTAITITSPSLTTSGAGTPWAAPIVYRDRLDLTFSVNVASPGAQMVSPLKGTVRVDDNGSTIYSISNYTVGDVLSRSLTPSTGAHTITVTFEGTADYAVGSSSFTIEVFNQPPTPTFTPTLPDTSLTVIPPAATSPVPNVTSTPPSAATALPPGCPQVNAQQNKIFTSYGSSFYFEIDNPKSGEGAVATSIDRIEVTWPSQYDVHLNEVRFGTAVSVCDVSTNCLLTGLNLPPTSAVLPPASGFNATVNSLPVDGNQTTKRDMLLVFNGALPSGAYTVKVHFANNNNCQIQVNATR